MIANRKLIEQIHAADGMFSLAIAGAGTTAVRDLFAVAGASASIHEVSIPYHGSANQRYLRTNKPHGCNAHTARALATESWHRLKEVNVNTPCFGVGLTAALATNRDRRGSDRCHIALQANSFTLSLDLELDKSVSRESQEEHCSAAVLEMMAIALNIDSESQFEVIRTDASEDWQALLHGDRKISRETTAKVLLSGAFNPLHEGHRKMLQIAASRYGSAAYELSITNVDKPMLDFATMAERAEQFHEGELVFTRAPTFIEKARLFPNTVFAVGLDTIVRIAETKYYADDTERDKAIREMEELGIRFLVFGRLGNDQFESLSDITLLPSLAKLCDEVSSAEFRADISSTEIRESQHVDA